MEDGPAHPRCVGQRTTVGGSAPNYLTVAGSSLFVSNGNNDMIERIDLASGEMQAKQRIVPSPLVAGLRGVGPSGMVVSPDGARLYVAESGINAIAVLDARTLQVLGHIPTRVPIPRGDLARRPPSHLRQLQRLLATDRTPARRSRRAISLG